MVAVATIFIGRALWRRSRASFRHPMVFGLFSKEKSLQKTIDRATNYLAQHIDRQGALDLLANNGTDEALFGLCKRWNITSTKGVEDEQEKQWVVDVLASKGEVVLPPLRRYMKSAEKIGYALNVVGRVASHEKTLEVVDELLAFETPGYVRMPERRIDLIRWFSEWKGGTDEEVVQRISPYVSDFDETSRFSAIEGLAGRDAGLIAPPLIEALLRPDEESGRIRRTIVEVLANGKVPLGDQAAAVQGALEGSGPLSGDFVVAGGIIKKR